MSHDTLEVMFEYTGKDHDIVPKTTTSVQFHPSVTEVGVGYGNPFNKCRNSLRRVTFNEGLQKIRNSLFCGCITWKVSLSHLPLL